MGERYPAFRYDDIIWEDCKNGVVSVECDSWEELENIIEKCKQKAYVWRGQSCEKSLLPTIYRDSKPNNDNIEKHLNQFKKDMPGADALEQFLEQAKKDRTEVFEKALSEYCNMTISKADDNDTIKNFIDDVYWAIGQHNELKTPLLDWTMDPYKALFFAFCERKESDDKRIVFGLAEKSRRLLHKGKPEKRYIELLTRLDFVQNILDSSDSLPDLKERIRLMFGRINEQDGVFTRSLQIENVEEHAKRCYRRHKDKGEGEIVFLIKILIPNGIRKDLLKKLKGKKITYKTMYPDLKGAALQCNLKLELRQ